MPKHPHTTTAPTPGPSRREALGTAALGTAAALTGLALAPAASAAPAGTPATASASTAARPNPSVLALTHATLLLTPNSRPLPDHTLLITDGRLTTYAPSAQLEPPPHAHVVDLTGKYVIPGLTESHIHTSGDDAITPPLFPLTGVTSVREMWGQPLHHDWRRRISAGTLLGPRFVIASPILDGPPSIWANDTGLPVLEVADAKSARAAVRKVKREGADFVKVYSRLSPESYYAIADESKRQHLPFAGHCPDTLPMSRAATSGQRSIEHLHAMLPATSSREREIRAALTKVRIDPNDPSSLSRYGSWFRQVHPLEWQAMRSYDKGRARRLFDTLAEHGTYVTPTLTVHHSLERIADLPTSSPDWKYLPAWTVASWPYIWEAMTGSRTPEDTARIRRIYEHRLTLVSEMHRAGVRLTAGTDTGTGYAVPGFSLHEELRLLSEAGLPTRDVLTTATTHPHDLLRLPTSRPADLLILNANPLTNIRHTLNIHSVVNAGHYLSPTDRTHLLAAVEKAASESTPPENGTLATPTPGCACNAPH
ncbi:amidohydrolase [Streptomyces spiroverticillatus]|uniref:Amidohydrolase n=1 Tax=Streptomyces finlayi TaxID=67296 RepID=A0A919CDD4_9ACTN|nr:amidohydrolase family protein [Streptomyces finlayi]GHA33376.1 amidohydrolase [Streptomyces spiroverticillatus]GHD11229.1 amidohydrolase [Streptomyces finlayi]